MNSGTKINAQPLPKLIDTATLAESLGVSERQVQRLKSQRLIPSIKLGGLVRFNPVAVAAAIEELTIQARR